jgi:hypothetical protein
MTQEQRNVVEEIIEQLCTSARALEILEGQTDGESQKAIKRANIKADDAIAILEVLE